MQSPIIPGAPDAEQVLSQVRANVAFENMLAAVLIGAAASGAALFVLSNLIIAVRGAWSFATLFSSGMDAVYLIFFAFLLGFLASVVIAMPLFLALERMKVRRVWPYLIAAAAVEYIALWIVSGRVPGFDQPAIFEFFLPGIVMALLFGRRMGPIWRAAERAGAQPAIYRVH